MSEEKVIFNGFIKGVPYPKRQKKGKEGADKWSKDIQEQTSKCQKIHGQCHMEVKFILSKDNCPGDYLEGADLDNLLKPLFNALKLTVFSKAPGDDGCVTRLIASKRLKRPHEHTGALVKLKEI